MKKFSNKVIELKLQGWKVISTSYTEDDCFVIIWLEKKAGTECDRDPFGNAIQGTTRDKYVRKEVCYDKWADVVEETKM